MRSLKVRISHNRRLDEMKNVGLFPKLYSCVLTKQLRQGVKVIANISFLFIFSILWSQRMFALPAQAQLMFLLICDLKQYLSFAPTSHLSLASAHLVSHGLAYNFAHLLEEFPGFGDEFWVVGLKVSLQTARLHASIGEDAGADDALGSRTLIPIEADETELNVIFIVSSPLPFLRFGQDCRR